jgi:hypothetical protein
MSDKVKNRLIEQGYSAKDVYENKNIINLTRWTPFSCALLGIIGLLIQSPIYFWVLGILTFIGPFRPWSFYDYAYKYFFSHLINLGTMPQHGTHRKIGCAVGAVIYITSGFGFYFHNIYLSYIPSIMIITIAIIAGIFGWCFISTVHQLFTKKEKIKCC